ncbi:DNA primase [Planctomycetales bacterium 10988]|nr:DNA primase [Planctomycetales bacterium 10988]
MFLSDDKERIRQAVNIVDLASAYLQLHSKGPIFKALCPWHDDHDPSLQINPNRQSYKCWVCGEGGDIFSFLMKMENISFPEAVRMLANRAGIMLEETSGPHASGKSNRVSEEKTALYELCQWAADQFHRCLMHSPEGEPGRLYLDRRGITEASMQQFQLGYSPLAWDWLVNKADKRFSPQLLEMAGLVAKRRQGNGVYDRFRGRALFPIRDMQGRPIAFGGRILPQFDSEHPAKYINSPETLLFNKSKTLYGLDVARTSITQTKQVIVTEGYTDCLMAHQFGVSQAVAVLGTALTEQHLPTLRGYAEQIYLVLDGDEAGRQRSEDLLALFIAHQMDLRILTLPENLDPCEFLLESGADAFRKEVEAAPDALEYQFQLAAKSKSAGVYAANTALDRLLHTLALAPRSASQSSQTAYQMKETQILQRAATAFQMDEMLLRKRLSELRQNRGQNKARLAKRESDARVQEPPLPIWEQELFELILTEPTLIYEVKESGLGQELSHPRTKNFWQLCEFLLSENRATDFSTFLLYTEDPAGKRILVDLDENAQRKSHLDAKARLQGMIRFREEQRRSSDWPKLRQSVQQNHLNEADSLAILQQMLHQKRSHTRQLPSE